MLKATCATLFAVALQSAAMPAPTTHTSAASTASPDPEAGAQAAIEVGMSATAGSSFEATMIAMKAEAALFEKCQIYFGKCQDSGRCTTAVDMMAAAVANARVRSGEPATPQLQAVVLGNLGMSSEEGARLFWCILGLQQPPLTFEFGGRPATRPSQEEAAAGALAATSGHSGLSKGRRKLRFIFGGVGIGLGAAGATAWGWLAGLTGFGATTAAATTGFVELVEIGTAVGTATAEVGTMTAGAAAAPTLFGAGAGLTLLNAASYTGVAVGAVLTFEDAKDYAYGDGLPLIHNVHGICLDSPQAWSQGGKVHMWDCNPREHNQHWVYSADTHQIRNKYNAWDGTLYCLDASERSKNGGKVHMWKCDQTNPNQWWDYDSKSGRIQNIGEGGLCLDTYERSKNGGGVHMWACYANHKNQQWQIQFEPNRRARAEPAALPCWVGMSVDDCRAQEEL